jgi:release factor glutamine methyltransferase
MQTVQQNERQWTILEILRWTTDYFREKSIQGPRLTAEVLLAHTLQQDRMSLYVHHDQPLEAEERSRFKTLVKQRIQGTPTQYLTGKQEFWSLEFQVAPGVLIPRPETEHLVEASINVAAQFPQLAIIDVGTGSGNVAISLKKEIPHAEVYASDISEAALEIAKRNAGNLLDGESRIVFRHGDLLQPFSGNTFDLIISNPPYVSAAEYETLSCEIREHEPKLALFAGEEGLDVYRQLIPQAHSYLNPHGYVLVEIGYGQKDSVVGIFEEHGFAIQNVIKDYAGIDRVMIACIGN